MEIEEAVKNLNNYIFAIDNFGTIDPKCCNNLYEPVKVVLKELDKKDKEIERKTEHAKYFSKERNKKIVRIGALENKLNDSIPKNKIREKLEKIEKEKEQYYAAGQHLMYMLLKNQLKSLLEEE